MPPAPRIPLLPVTKRASERNAAPRGLRSVAVVAAIALSLGGCRATFSDPRVPAGEEKSKWAHFYAIGAIGHEEIDVRDYCKTARAREVVLGADVFTVIVSIVTLGIYTPRKVTVTCAAESAKAQA